MTARFKKVHHVSLVNAQEDGEDDLSESDKSLLISEDEEREDNNVEEGITTFSPDTGAGKLNWRFWKKQRRYEVTHAEEESEQGRQITLFGRTFHLCKINSWRVIFLVLFVFSVAVTISVILSKVAAEPPEIGIFNQGAVVSDAAICANMSADILRRNGSAVDAAITAMLCNGVVQGESSGLGGGGFMVVYLQNGSTYTINFRETAPLASFENMFHANASVAQKSGLSVAVPGELRGMEKAHQLFGRLPWKDLFQPVIDLCRDGFYLTNHTASALQAEWDRLPPNFHRLYGTADGSYKKVGDVVQNPTLAETLEAIAANGTSAFYRAGRIAQSIVDTVEATGGIITLEDLEAYSVKMATPLQADFNGHTFFSPPSPSGGPMFLFILSLLDLYQQNSTSDHDLAYHRLLETFKFGFAERTGLGDPYCNDEECEEISQWINDTQRNMFNATYVSEIWSLISDDVTFNVSHYNPHYFDPEDSGTSHISILSPEGDAVAVTTTVNTLFGANIMTETGIVLNDEMDDFSSPNLTNAFGLRPSQANFIRPNKRPLSSTCPTIAVSKMSNGTQVYMVIGGAGGTHIPTAVVQAVLGVSTFGQSISSAIETRRLHHQLLPNNATYETGFPEGTLRFLESKGHVLSINTHKAEVQGVVMDSDGHVTAHADSRKSGRAVLVENTQEQPTS